MISSSPSTAEAAAHGAQHAEADGGHGAVADTTGDPRRPADPVAVPATLLVLGASGDLASRLLLPGLANMVARSAALAGEGTGDVGGDRALQLVGAGVEDIAPDDWYATVRDSFAGAGLEVTADDAEGDPPGEGEGAVRELLESSWYRRCDVTADGQLRELVDACTAPVAVYFALPPHITSTACEALARSGVPDGTRLVLEKPFGFDQTSAHELNALVASIVPEDHVHRVDHFLGRSTTLGLLGLRFANRLLEPMLTREHVERVDVFYDEDLALEDRARYYDGAGALVDMVQSHLLQVMALLAMDPPASLGERDLRDRKAELLRATRVAGDPAVASRRARYTAGTSRGRDVPSYAEEPGVDPERGTETLGEVELLVDTWRWAGVPFRLRSGKGLGQARKEAVITFRKVPHLVTGLHGEAQPTRLRLGFSPDTVTLQLMVNSPDDPFDMEYTQLSSQMGAPDLPAYGQVLAGVLAGDPTLSVRGDTAEDCWRILDPVIEAWRRDEVPLEEYAAGGDGPSPTERFPDV